ncbi:MAG: hypothetical protein JSU66_17495 [Deltaproteobacteria bacterium]|nr:MAG: hypothetical protein JSU66_17495 [Deltaproteobacteria bacterium]
MAVAVAPDPRSLQKPRHRTCTLLELVQSVGAVTASDEEVVATVMYMLRTGRVRLCGNFRDEPIELLCEPGTSG